MVAGSAEAAGVVAAEAVAGRSQELAGGLSGPPVSFPGLNGTRVALPTALVAFSASLLYHERDVAVILKGTDQELETCCLAMLNKENILN